MRVGRILTLVAIGTAVLMVAPGGLDAHTRTPTRAVVLQMDAVGVASLWEAMVPGAPAELMGAIYDVDRDGVFNAREGRALGQVIIAKALNGVRLSWNGEAVNVLSIEALLERDAVAGKPLIALALATLAIEPGQGGVLSLTLERGGDLEVQVQGLDDWFLVGTDRGRLASDGRGLAASVTLRAGERIQLVVEKLAAESPAKTDVSSEEKPGDRPGNQR